MYTDDPKQRQINLSVRGTVKSFVSIHPKNIRLIGIAGQPIRATVTIIPKKEYPFKIVATKAQAGEHIRYQLEEEKQSGSATYLLTVENLKKDKGRYYDTIELTTDSRHRQKIRIKVYGQISDPAKKDTK